MAIFESSPRVKKVFEGAKSVPSASSSRSCHAKSATSMFEMSAWVAVGPQRRKEARRSRSSEGGAWMRFARDHTMRECWFATVEERDRKWLVTIR